MTVMTPRAGQVAPPHGGNMGEQRFYSTYMICVAVVILAGFVPSFFLRGIVPPIVPMNPLSPLAILHGIVGTVFTFMLPLQAWLIASGRRAVHIRAGRIGFAVGALLLPINYLLIAAAYERALATRPPTLAAFSAMPLTTLACMTMLLGLAWWRRFDGPAHKRLMVVLACLVARPSISRLYPFTPDPAGFFHFEAVAFGMLAPLWIWDIATLRRPHWATLAGTALTMLFPFFIRGSASAGTWWAPFVVTLPGF